MEKINKEEVKSLGGELKEESVKIGNAIWENIGGAFSDAAKAVNDFIKDSTGSFANFEDGMTQVFTLMPELSDTSMNEMRNQVKEFSKEFGVLPEEVIPELYTALAAGIPEENVFSFLEAAQKSSESSFSNLHDTVETMIGVMGGYGDATFSAQDVSAMLFMAIKNGNTTMEELAGSFGELIPYAQDANVGFDELAAGVSTMTSVMGEGSTPKAVEGLGDLFSELSDSTSSAYKAFEDLTGKSFPDFMAGGGSLSEVLDIIQQSANETGISVADMFDSAASKDAISVLTNNKDVFVSNMDDMNNAADDMGGTYENILGNSSEKLDSLTSNWEVLKIEIGEKLLPVLVTLGEKLLKVFNENQPAIDKLIESFSTLVGSIGDEILNLAVEILPLLLDAFQWAIDNGDLVIAALTGIAVGFMIISASASSLTLIALIIAGIITAVTYLAENWDEIVQFLTDLWDGFVQFLTDLLTSFVEFWQGVWQGISDFFTEIWNNISEFFIELWNGIVEWFTEFITGFVEFWSGIWQGISDFFTNIWNGISEFFMELWNGIVEWFTERATAFIEFWNGIWQGISDFFTNIWNGISEFFIELWNGIVEWFTELITEFVEFWSGIWQGISDFFTNIWNGISEFFMEIWNGIVEWFTERATAFTEFWNGIWQGISSFFSGIWNGISGFFKGLWNGIVTWFTNSLNNIANFFGNIWTGISNTFSTIWDNIKGIFETVWNNITGMFSNVGTWFADVGKNIVSGIWNGISNMVEWIKNKIMGFASSVMGWFKNFFGIESPSKLMRDMIGKNLALGISVGFTDNIDDVFGDMEMSVSSNMDKLAIDSSGKTLVGQQVTNNDNGIELGPIIIQQPVSSPAETARAIKREAVALLG